MHARLLALLICATPAAAQETPPPVEPETPVVPIRPLAEPATEEPVQLDEVVVTATKRPQSVRDIPVSIDAYDADEMNERGAQSSQDALAYSPGVSLNRYYSPDFVNVQIRGTTTSTDSSIGGAAVGIFFDDIPLASPSLVGGNPNIDSFDLETIELLKGPQGTLFGGSALAGVLRSVPKAPELMSFSASGFYARMPVADSSDDGKDYGLMLNLPIGETLALRGVGVQRRYPGAVDNLYDGVPDSDHYRSQQTRSLLSWQPSAALSVQGLLHNGKGKVNDIAFTDQPQELTRSSESGNSPSDSVHRISQLKASYAWESFSLTAAVARLGKDSALTIAVDHSIGGQTEANNAMNIILTDAKIRTQELRAVSVAPTSSAWAWLDQWDWLAGFYDYEADQGLTSLIASQVGAPGGLPLPQAPGAETVKIVASALASEQAFYFDLTRPLAEGRWEVSLGGRFFRQQNLFNSVITASGLPTDTQNGTQENHGFNPKLALTWKPSAQIALRASASKGFRFGGVNAVLDGDPDAPPFYDTDELWNYELGLRSDWLDRTLRVDLTAFYIDWTRVQITQRTHTGISQFIDNVGSAISKGAELSTRLRLPFGLSATLAGAYVDSRTHSDFEGANGPIAKDTRLPGTPYLTGSALLGYDQPLGSALFNAGFSASYQGRAFDTLTHQNEIPSYEVYGLNAGLSWPGAWGKPSLNISANNLLDTRAYNGVTTVQGVTDYFPIRPRTVLSQISFSF